MTRFMWVTQSGGLMHLWRLDLFWKVMIFQGKTIVPFCTSQDNGIDVSMDYIRKNAKNAEVLEGHRIHNSDSAEIKTWLKEIGTIS